MVAQGPLFGPAVRGTARVKYRRAEERALRYLAGGLRFLATDAATLWPNFRAPEGPGASGICPSRSTGVRRELVHASRVAGSASNCDNLLSRPATSALRSPASNPRSTRRSMVSTMRLTPTPGFRHRKSDARSSALPVSPPAADDASRPGASIRRRETRRSTRCSECCRPSR